LKNPTHQYSLPGVYKVVLTVLDDDGLSNTQDINVTVVINTPPLADTGGPYFGRRNTSILFDGSGSIDQDGSIIGYRWDFENDSEWDTDWLSTPTITKSYTLIGTYEARLEVEDDDGAISSDTTDVTISDNAPPVADAGGPYDGHTNELIQVDGSKSSDSDGTIERYRWDWTNDGTWDTSWIPSSKATHKYSNAAVHTIGLQVKDNEGLTAEDFATITITDNTQPTADAGGPYLAHVNEHITFDASASMDIDGLIDGYRWDWTNDGVYDTGWLSSAQITHQYALAETYMVTVQVKDDDGATDLDTASVQVSDSYLEGFWHLD
jgi:PKD repeat protein